MAETTITAMRNAADAPTLIRKISQAAAFFAPLETAMPAKLTGGTGLLEAIPAGWVSLGIVTPEGYTFGSETTSNEVEAYGYSSPVRTDIEKVVKSIKVTPLEFGKRQVLEMLFGMDLSSIKQDKITGSIVFDEPSIPMSKEYRLLVIGVDGIADNEWIIGLGFPRVKITEMPETVFSPTDAYKFSISFTASTDTGVGTACRHYIEGTGPKAAKATLGFTQSP
jgi:hypothetical protein